MYNLTKLITNLINYFLYKKITKLYFLIKCKLKNLISKNQHSYEHHSIEEKVFLYSSEENFYQTNISNTTFLSLTEVDKYNIIGKYLNENNNESYNETKNKSSRIEVNGVISYLFFELNKIVDNIEIDLIFTLKYKLILCYLTICCYIILSYFKFNIVLIITQTVIYVEEIVVGIIDPVSLFIMNNLSCSSNYNNFRINNMNKINSINRIDVVKSSSFPLNIEGVNASFCFEQEYLTFDELIIFFVFIFPGIIGNLVLHLTECKKYYFLAVSPYHIFILILLLFFYSKI
jgi:hypothetical protein